MKSFIKGCEILSKYDEDATLCAEHDIIYTTVEKISDEDAAILEELPGWHFDSDNGCWSYFT